MRKLFSYVVHHDTGFAPNPFGGFCSLAKCKYGSEKRRNIVEMAKVGDWIVGTGGADLRQSAGHGKLIYAMRVDEIIPLNEYCQTCDDRIDAGMVDDGDHRFALISNHFFYFGRSAIDISDIPQTHLSHPFEKCGPGHRSDFSEKYVEKFAKWLEANFKPGLHGAPCKPHSKLKLPRRAPQVRRRGRKG